jgi:hypothetical protein
MIASITRYLFLLVSFVVVIVYYLGISKITKEADLFTESLQPIMYALTGRNEVGQFIHDITVVDADEEEQPYYWPQVPKNEDDVIYS